MICQTNFLCAKIEICQTLLHLFDDLKNIYFADMLLFQIYLTQHRINLVNENVRHPDDVSLAGVENHVLPKRVGALEVF